MPIEILQYIGKKMGHLFSRISLVLWPAKLAWGIQSILKECSQPQIRKPRMLIGAPPERPEILAVGLPDRQIVDARVSFLHQSIGIEFPILVSVGTKPIPTVVVPLVGKPDRDPVF